MPADRTGKFSIDAIAFRDIMVPMADGTRLATDILLPTSSDGRAPESPLPALLARTPYGKSHSQDFIGAAAWLRRGIAVVVQDKRGCHASEGRHRLLRDDGIGNHRDGYDSVRWLAAQRWCSGRVGTTGISYLGHTALGAALAHPGALVAAAPVQPSSDPFNEQMFPGGVLNLTSAAWNIGVGDELITHLPVELQKQASNELAEARRAGPLAFCGRSLIDLPFHRLLRDFWGEAIRHRDDPAYFGEAAPDATALNRVSVPTLHVGGWFDPFLGNSLRQYQAIAAAGRVLPRLVVGPWLHAALGSDRAGDSAFPDAAIDWSEMVASWMQPHLQGVTSPNGPPVLLYVMGANRWRAEAAWPLPDSRTVDFYLRAGGVLVGKPPNDESPDHFSYDPDNPYRAPSSTGGPNNCAIHLVGTNLLYYTSEPFASPVEITGEITVTLFAASSALDTDWLVELHQATADGRSLLISEGICRARYRHGRTVPTPLEPGEVQSYRIGLRATSVVVPRGDALRVVVTSGKFPAFERSPNRFADVAAWNGTDPVVARQSIYHDAWHPSAIHLPLIERTKGKASWIDNPAPLQSQPCKLRIVERPASSL